MDYRIIDKNIKCEFNHLDLTYENHFVGYMESIFKYSNYSSSQLGTSLNGSNCP